MIDFKLQAKKIFSCLFVFTLTVGFLPIESVKAVDNLASGKYVVERARASGGDVVYTPVTDSNGNSLQYSDVNSAIRAMKAQGNGAYYVVRHKSNPSPLKIVAANYGFAQTWPDHNYNYTTNSYKVINVYDKYGGAVTYVNTGRIAQYKETVTINGSLYVHVLLSGADGYIKLNEVDIIPTPYISNGIPVKYGNGISGVLNIPTYKAGYDGSIKELWFRHEDYSYYSAVGVAPSWMRTDTEYYSFDGNYFYTDYEFSKRANSSPYYNYYQYLPVGSKSKLTAAQLDAITLDAVGSYSSAMKGLGKAFTAYQGIYDMNGLLVYSLARLESATGTSWLALNKYNLFGWNAVDSNPIGDASTFASPMIGVRDHMGVNLKSLSNVYDWRYFGSFFGNKGAGFNVKYASDPYWGQSVASLAYRADKANGLVDYNAYQLAVLKPGKNVTILTGPYSSASPVLTKTSYDGAVDSPLVIKGYSKGLINQVLIVRRDQSAESKGYYKVYLPNASYSGKDWDTYFGYIPASDLTFINQGAGYVPPSTVPADPAVPTSIKEVGKLSNYVVSSGPLNVRQSNTTQSNSYGTLDTGTKIQGIEVEGGWIKMKYDSLTDYSKGSKIGYMAKEFMDFKGEVNSTTIEKPTVSKGKWKLENGQWKCLKSDNTFAKSEWAWLPVEGKTGLYNYKFFNSAGVSINQFYKEIVNGQAKSYLSQAGPYKEYYKGWWKDPSNGQKYYFRTTSGSMVEGRQYIDGNWYYFRTGSGTQAFGKQYIAGVWRYYHDLTGVEISDYKFDSQVKEIGKVSFYQVASGPLNVRPEPIKSNTPYGTLDEGTKIEGVEVEGGWIKMKYDSPGDYTKGSKTGYIVKEFMSLYNEKPTVVKNKWVEETGKWKYAKADGSFAKSEWLWLPIEGKTGVYNHKYFNAEGVSIDQFYKDMFSGQAKYYLSQAGPKEEYYKGWWTDPANGQRYYFRTTSGSRAEGRQYINKNWYYFRIGSGTQAFGKQYIDGVWRYYHDETGIEVSNYTGGSGPKEIGKVSFYQVASGPLNVRPEPTKSSTPYGTLDEGTKIEGVEVEGGWIKMKYDSLEDYAKGSKTGYMAKEFMSLLSNNQEAITNKWIEEGGKWKYAKADGSLAKSEWVWLPVEGKTGVYNYKYFNPDGVSTTQFYKDTKSDQIRYYLSQAGPKEEYRRGWWTNPANNQKYYFRIASGSMVEGRQYIDGNWYYFRVGSGTQAFGKQYIDGVWKYYHDETGVELSDYNDKAVPENNTSAEGKEILEVPDKSLLEENKPSIDVESQETKESDENSQALSYTITAGTLKVRKDPNPESDVYGYLYEGQVVECVDYDDDWLMIKFDSPTDYAKGKVVAYISKTFAIKK